MRRSLASVCLLALATALLVTPASATIAGSEVAVPAFAGPVMLVPDPRLDLRGGGRLLAAGGAPALVVGAADAAHARAVARRARLQGARARVLGELAAVRVEGDDLEQLVWALSRDPQVRYLEPERRLRPLADPFDVVDPATGISYVWAADAVNAPAALAAVGGTTAFPIAVVDTGVDVTHPDLAGRVVATYNAVDGSADASDPIGHGTFVAGLIGAIDGNAIGIRGAGGGTSLLAARASTPQGTFGELEIGRAMLWAIDNGARVINLSLGGSCPSGTPLLEAINYATSKGVLVVAASGNNALVGNVPNCPAYELGGANGDWGVGLSVGAARPDAHRGAFSTYNDHLSVLAPGASGSDCRFGVVSTLPSTPTIWDNPLGCSVLLSQSGVAARWAYGEGTSFAAPVAAAVAAIAWQASPQLAPAQVAEVVKRSAFQVIGAGWNAETGYGRVDALAAVDLARRFDTTPPQLVLTAQPQPLRLSIAVDVADVPAAPQDAVGGVTLTLEKSRDGVSFEPWLPVRDSGISADYAASRAGPPHFFRATACDANRNCVSQQLGPVEPLLVRPKLRVRPVLRKGVLRAVVIRLTRPEGMRRGKARVLVQVQRGKRFQTIATATVPFGKAVRRSVRLRADEPLRVRATVLERADWKRATSRTVRVAGSPAPA